MSRNGSRQRIFNSGKGCSSLPLPPCRDFLGTVHLNNHQKTGFRCANFPLCDIFLGDAPRTAFGCAGIHDPVVGQISESGMGQHQRSGYRRMQSMQSIWDTTAPLRRLHRPPVQPQPRSVERNWHALMLCITARASETSGLLLEGRRLREGRELAVFPDCSVFNLSASALRDADRVRMWRILISSGGTSAAHSQKAAQATQTSGHGQRSHASLTSFAPC